MGLMESEKRKTGIGVVGDRLARARKILRAKY
jgi:hypothetical protein